MRITTVYNRLIPKKQDSNSQNDIQWTYEIKSTWEWGRGSNIFYSISTWISVKNFVQM